MNPETLVPLIGTLITFIVSIGVSILIFKKNSDYKLNKYFAGFFLTISLGFFAYFFYHILFEMEFIIYLFFYVARVSYALGGFFLLITTFLFEHSEKMEKKYYYYGYIYLFFALIGYLFFYPELDQDVLVNEGRITLKMNKIWDLCVVIAILLVLIFTLYIFASRLRTTDGFVRKKVKYFTVGMVFAIIAVLLIVLSISTGIIQSLLKIIGIFSMDVGVILFYLGISLKPPTK